jgi:hypothetical protein
MKLTHLCGFAAVIAFTLLSGTPSFARGGGHGGGHGAHGGHGGHGHASVRHGGQAHHFANHAHFAGRHFGANHSFVHNHAGWNHNGWGHGWGNGRGWGYGGHGWAWGRPGWWGRGYGSSGLGYLAAGVVDPSFYYQYLNNVTGTGVPATNRTVTRNYVADVIQPVTPALSATAPIGPDPVVSPQSDVTPTAGATVGASGAGAER